MAVSVISQPVAEELTVALQKPDIVQAMDVSDYGPFITNGFVSLVGSPQKVPVKILRDTEALESFILESVLPFSQESSVGSSVLIRANSVCPFA